MSRLARSWRWEGKRCSKNAPRSLRASSWVWTACGCRSNRRGASIDGSGPTARMRVAEAEGRDGMELGLRGRKAVVTGASKGIGGACAEVLAAEGCDVVLVSRTAADLEAARAAIVAKHNVAVRFYPLDLSDSRNVDKLAAECADTDLLVNNAGAIPGGDIAQIDEARWRTAWD